MDLVEKILEESNLHDNNKQCFFLYSPKDKTLFISYRSSSEDAFNSIIGNEFHSSLISLIDMIDDINHIYIIRNKPDESEIYLVDEHEFIEDETYNPEELYKLHIKCDIFIFTECNSIGSLISQIELSNKAHDKFTVINKDSNLVCSPDIITKITDDNEELFDVCYKEKEDEETIRHTCMRII